MSRFCAFVVVVATTVSCARPARVVSPPTTFDRASADTVNPDGVVAWFDEDLLGDRVGPTRGAGVLVRMGGRWLLATYDLSITIPNDRFDAVRAVVEAK
jgi:hypothetical protein